MSEISYGDATSPALKTEGEFEKQEYTPLSAEQIKELLGGFDLSAVPEMQGSPLNEVSSTLQNPENTSDLSTMMNLMGEIHTTENGTKDNVAQSIITTPQVEAKGFKKLMQQISNFFSRIFWR